MAPPVHRRSGYSLLEVCLSASALLLILGSTAMVAMRGSESYESTSRQAAQTTSARENADHAVRELTAATSASLIADPFQPDAWRFQKPIGFVGGAPVPSDTRRLAFRYEPGEVDDGLDNDGDGLIDEGELAYTTNVGTAVETTVVWCRGVCEYFDGESQNGLDDNGNLLVDERGFHLDRNGELVTLRLAIEHRDEDGVLVERTIETTIRLRN